MRIQTAKHRRLLAEKRRQLHLPFGAERFLAILEGLEGGFAVGASVIVGLSFASLDRRILLLSAAISIMVNGFNSATVKYSSEHYEDELDGREKSNPWRYYFVPAAIEFVAYFVISFVTLLPRMLIGNQLTASVLCCALTLIMLFSAGYWRGFLMRMHPTRDGFEMALLGSGIIIVGVVTGFILNL
jgi:hypothetical protein